MTGPVLVVGAGAAEKTLTQSFSALDCLVEHVSTARAAVESVRARQPALAVLEWWLPDGIGLDLIHETRAISPSTRLVVVTASASIPAALASIRAGASDYMTKPVTAMQILSSLGETVPRARDEVDSTEHWLTLQQARREYIRDVLSECRSISKTARVLRLDRTSLRRMMARFDLSRSTRGHAVGQAGDPGLQPVDRTPEQNL